MKNKNVRDLVLCSLFVALIAIGAFIKIPIKAESKNRPINKAIINSIKDNPL